MASSVSISRLHAVNNLSPQGDAKPTPVTQTEAPSLLELAERSWAMPLRKHFGSGRRLDAPPMMSAMHPPVVPEGRNSFAALAAQDRFRALLAKHPRRGADDAQPWAAIQL
jgi:hypothetical protein